MLNTQLQSVLIKAIYDTSPDGILVVDNKGVIVSHNQQFLDIWQIPDTLLTGVEPSTLNGRENVSILYFILTLVRDKQTYITGIKELYSNSDINDLCEIDLLDGSILERQTLMLYDIHGQPLGRVWFFRDITERKKDLHDSKMNQYSLKNSQDAIFRIDKNAGIEYINDAACHHLGYTEEDLLTLTIMDIDPTFTKEKWRTYWEEMKDKGWQRFEATNKRKDGTIVPVEIVSNFMTFEDKAYGFASVRDISERKRNEDVLRTLSETGSQESDDVFKTIVRQLALTHNMRYVLIGRINPLTRDSIDTLAVWGDGDSMANFSYRLEDTPCQILLKEDIFFYPDNIQAKFPQNHLLADLDVKSFLGTTLKNKLGNVVGNIAMMDDKPMAEMPQTISLLNSLAVRVGIELERREAEEKHNLASRIFNDTHEGILITASDGTIIDVNPTFTAITGYSREEALGNNPRMLSSGRQSSEFYTNMWQLIAEQGYWQGELWNRKKDGTLFAEMLTISALKDKANYTTNYISFFSDITTSKQQQEKLELMAHYDVLTKLPNRLLFADRFQQAVAHSKRTDTLVAICFLDLDDFKLVNDNYGHEMGNHLLIEVAKRIKNQIREEDTVSRQGGDEFTLLLTDITSLATCEQMLKRICYVVAQPFVINEQAFKISASIGVTLYPTDKADLETLLRHADQAMYQAKITGRNRFTLFNAEEDLKLIEKNHRLEEIQNALVNNEFRLYYQPKVNMRTGEVFGAEALIRWLHPKEGLIPPLDFLPVIDGTDLEIEVGNWVLNQALQQLADWKKRGIVLEVSINVPSHQLLSSPFIDGLDNALAAHADVESKYLQLEVLESSALGDLDTIRTIITTCQDTLGIHVALDDFGTGYSSLTHMRKLPANIIKIDQSFVRDILSDPDDYAIIKGVIGLANAFNRQIIAEGVETSNHGLLLLKMGCELAQGYSISRPMPAEELPAWLKNYRANDEWMALGNELLVLKEKL